MKIHPDLQKTWRDSYEHGDYAAISEECGITALTARKAIELGVCSRNTMEGINAYFVKKNARPEEIINKIKGS